MKNRDIKNNTTVNNNDIHSTKSVPNLKEILALLLAGQAIDHQDVIKAHGGEQHRLGIAIHRLRHKHGFGHLIQCPRGKSHPLQYKYFIAPSDISEALKLAAEQGLLLDNAA
jgi:hypothetical protein